MGLAPGIKEAETAEFLNGVIAPSGSTRAVTHGRTSSCGRAPTTFHSWEESAVTKSVSSR